MRMNKVNQLLYEIEQLEEKNSNLRKEIKKIDEKELFETVRYYTNFDKYKFYRTIPFSFINTPFYTQRYELQKIATGCFINEILDNAIDISKIRLDKELILHFAMKCEDVAETMAGVIFTLYDPYLKIQTLPVNTITIDEAEKYRGYMVMAKIKIPEEYRKTKFFELKGIKLVSLKCKENIYRNEFSIFKKYEKVSDDKTAVTALNEIENYFKMSGSRVYRCSPTILRVIQKDLKSVISYDKGSFWYADESYSYSEVGSMIFDMFSQSDKLKEFYLEGEECDV